MIKSEEQIEEDVFVLLEPYLNKFVEGGVYRNGCRPGDSKAEDAVIAVSNASADQIQVGHVYVNIYVPDVNNGTGFLVPAKGRLTELSGLHESLCEYMNERTTDEYTFYPGKSAKTIPESNIHQHFVSMDIEFQRTTF